MFSRFLLAAAPLLLAVSGPAHSAASDVSAKDLRRHVVVLASDDYGGRLPGTDGETRTIAYISSQLAAAGIEPGVAGGWYQPVGLVNRAPFGHRVGWKVAGRTLPFAQEDAVFIGREASERIAGAPVWFVGHGLVMPDRKIDQLAGADLRGAVALILYDPPKLPNFPSFAERVKAVTAAGALAVIGIVGDEIPWTSITGSYAAGQNRLQIDPVARVQGAIPLAAAERIVNDSGGNFRALVDGDPGPQFRAVRLPPTVDLEVSTKVRAYTSHNVIGRLRGSGGSGESLLYLGHWDHLGTCGAEGAADRICNGAVDNASGIAMLIEAARRLARGPRPVRDILFMATTAEEVGLLGAEYFGRKPVVPLPSLVAAINMDTVAIAGAGEAVAVLGRGTAPLDRIIDETVGELGRRLDTDNEADNFVTRQDGWALARMGVPAVMVGGSFSNMQKLGAFLTSRYHKADDDLSHPIELDGAAEDTELLVALGRKLADPKLYQPPKR